MELIKKKRRSATQREYRMFSQFYPLEMFNKHIINMLKAVNKRERKCFIMWINKPLWLYIS